MNLASFYRQLIWGNLVEKCEELLLHFLIIHVFSAFNIFFSLFQLLFGDVIHVYRIFWAGGSLLGPLLFHCCFIHLLGKLSQFGAKKITDQLAKKPSYT
ncbi:hypothetical protein Aconfl_06500 [Algoriphagus confluentis]|uniref:2TM domain-containing protein n=1 Tax=Algoriphagus confluentis TaxID=1697556 RepID=A0ABQ6PJ73_9BACT|nr:hypothetical protein Aconfl_06500 [Algoriphagus confluentis]